MIDRRIEAYLELHTTEERELLKRLRRDTHLKTVYPQMLSGPVMGRFLEMVSKMIAPSSILEIGTFTGYSAICLAQGLKPGGTLHTIESNPEMISFSAPYFREAGLEEIIKQHKGDALEIIPGLDHTFELVFIDAAKDQYTDYYNAVIDKIPTGGVILADNVLWDSKVLDPDDGDKDTSGIVRFNEFVSHDDRVEKVMLPIRDGIFFIRKLG